MDIDSLTEAVKQQLARKGDKFLCEECGCNVVHPHNSNFLLVFTTGTGLITVHGLQLATSNLRAWKTLINPESIFGTIDLGEEEREDMSDGDIMEMLEGCVDSYNVVKDYDAGTQYCPTCAERLGLV